MHRMTGYLTGLPYFQLAPPPSVGTYSNKAMDWFNEQIMGSLTVRLRLCEGCPVLLASIYSNGVELSERMKSLNYGVNMPDAEFENKRKASLSVPPTIPWHPSIFPHPSSLSTLYLTTPLFHTLSLSLSLFSPPTVLPFLPLPTSLPPSPADSTIA